MIWLMLKKLRSLASVIVSAGSPSQSRFQIDTRTGAAIGGGEVIEKLLMAGCDFS